MTGTRLQFLKCFDCSNDRAMLVVNGNGANANRNFVSGFVMQKPDALDRMRGFDGAGSRTLFVAEFAARLIALQQRLGGAGAANDIVTQMAGDAFGPIAPKDNLLLHVEDRQSRGQTFKNAAAGLGLVE